MSYMVACHAVQAAFYCRVYTRYGDIHTASACHLMALKYYEYPSMVLTGVWWGHLRQGDHLEDLGIGRSIILKWISNRWDREYLLGMIWLRIGLLCVR